MLERRSSEGTGVDLILGFLSHNMCLTTWTLKLHGCGSKLHRRGYAGFGPSFRLPGFHFGTGVLSHGHILKKDITQFV